MLTVKVCFIGFHSTFLNSATTASGIYVSIKNGKVKIDLTFLKLVALILFHSTKMVISPKININNIKFTMQKSIEVRDEEIHIPIDKTPIIPKNITTALKIRDIIVSNIPGAIVINIS